MFKTVEDVSRSNPYTHPDSFCLVGLVWFWGFFVVVTVVSHSAFVSIQYLPKALKRVQETNDREHVGLRVCLWSSGRQARVQLFKSTLSRFLPCMIPMKSSSCPEHVSLMTSLQSEFLQGCHLKGPLFVRMFYVWWGSSCFTTYSSYLVASYVHYLIV